jgi:hypothetical protein
VRPAIPTTSPYIPGTVLSMEGGSSASPPGGELVEQVTRMQQASKNRHEEHGLCTPEMDGVPGPTAVAGGTELGDCALCSEPVDLSPRSRFYREEVGWSLPRSEGGTNSLRNKRFTGRVAHEFCVKHGSKGLL